MLKNMFNKITKWEVLILISIVVLMFVSWFFLVRNIQMANRAGIFHRNETISQLLTNNRKTNLTTVKDIEFIDTWMTFQYVNFIFNLPDGYLKDTMKIDNIQYPKLPIGKYVKQKKLDKVQFLEEVKKSVREYMNANPAK